MAAGEAQFNTNCWIRGRMVAMTGEFSGTFSAQVVDVAESVNIRNGAVSTYLQFSATPPNPDRKESLKTMEFVVQQQPFPGVIDITIPMTITFGDYGGQYSPRIRWSRNGVVLREDFLNDYTGKRTFFNSARLLDFDVPANEVVIYKVELIDYYTEVIGTTGYGDSFQYIFEYGSGGVGTGLWIGYKLASDSSPWYNPYIQMFFKGKALVGIRKR